MVAEKMWYKNVTHKWKLEWEAASTFISSSRQKMSSIHNLDDNEAVVFFNKGIYVMRLIQNLFILRLQIGYSFYSVSRSVRPPVCPSVRLSTCSPTNLNAKPLIELIMI